MGKRVILLVFFCVFFLSSCAPPPQTDDQILKDPAKALDICAKTPADKQTGCYMRISELTRTSDPDTSFSACSAIKENDPRKGCEQDFINAQAKSIKPDTCSKLDFSDLKRDCIEKAAAAEPNATKAVSICAEIKDDQNFLEHCLNLVMGSSTGTDAKLAACDMRTGTNRDYCLQEIGTGLFLTQPSKGVEVCKKISDANIRNSCLNNFMGSPELIKANPAIGEEVCSSMTLKDNCYNNLANALSASDPRRATEACKKLSDEIQISNCFNMVWFSFNDRIIHNFDLSMSLCSSLKLKKDDCYRRIAGAMMNVDKAKAEQACKMISGGCMQPQGQQGPGGY